MLHRLCSNVHVTMLITKEITVQAAKVFPLCSIESKCTAGHLGLPCGPSVSKSATFVLVKSVKWRSSSSMRPPMSSMRAMTPLASSWNLPAICSSRLCTCLQQSQPLLL